MSAEFSHLHVASSFSLRYGASPPAELVARAVEQGQGRLALTDRDGLYGAVRFAQACHEARVEPVLGVDLALRPSPVQPPPAAGGARRRSAPVKGGALRDDQHPRITVLARGQQAGLAPGAGWAALCRVVSATHLAGERGSPLLDRAELARWVVTGGPTGGGPTESRGDGESPLAGDGDRAGVPALTVLLGPWSDVGQALLQRQHALARELLRQWQQLLPPASLVIEVVCHAGPPGTPASLQHAAALWGLALEAEVPAVLTAAARHAAPDEAATVDVLDAARRMVALDTRHLDRITRAGHLAPTAVMQRTAHEVADAVGVVGGRPARAADLLTATERLAEECVQHPRRDLGIGSVHLPEPHVLGLTGQDPQQVLTERCRAAVPTRYAGARDAELRRVQQRLDDELGVVRQLGYPTYFLTVAKVCDLIREMDVRVAARGSGAGSIITYLLGISGVEPLRHDLLMERFCSPLRAQLPDIDVDVESARRTEVYERILDRFGGDRVTCVSMMDTYRVRHAIRDVGSALGMAPVEIDAIAKAFPHIRARDARSAIQELPELRSRGLGAPQLELLFELVERVDGLPRHIALHPCGVVLSDGGLLDRTPVEASWLGFPMSQFDKDDVEALGLLKLDVLGIRMQSAMTHAVAEIERVDGTRIDLDDRAQVPLDDERTFELVRSTRTLGCFQIESPGQRELVGKFAPETFEDLVIDISLFRPGPVKSDMVTPFLEARQGWREPTYLHPSLEPALRSTGGVVVFHEQVLQIVAETTGVTLAQADEVRRALGSSAGQEEVERWWRPAAAARGYDPDDVDRIWAVLAAFASFGFCKAHAAAFALPTYQSAWLKAHHPAAFLAGVLTHDPGMYPKRLILADARQLGIRVLGLDVNRSGRDYLVERVESDAVVSHAPHEADLADPRDLARSFDHSGAGYGIRIALADVKGITDAEIDRVVAGQPYASLADFWQRSRVSRPVVERLVLAGGFDDLYALRDTARRGRMTRRDLLLHISELDRWSHSFTPSGRRSTRRPRVLPMPREQRGTPDAPGAPPTSSTPQVPGRPDPAQLAAAQSQGARPSARPAAPPPAQLLLDLGDEPELTAGSGLPEMTDEERVQAELEILGLDVSTHVVSRYAPLLEALDVARSGDLVRRRSGAELWVAGVKVATQTPPVRSGRRVVFLTLDDSTGPVDATFFEDVQGPYAATVFHSWLLLVRGVLRRTGPRGSRCARRAPGSSVRCGTPGSWAVCPRCSGPWTRPRRPPASSPRPAPPMPTPRRQGPPGPARPDR
ncbi:DNA polymerase III subunit alpha [Barrientosiimonas humi]|uniref:DNA polymerase III subunit alpha n=1 Tax=Barrientosiimonas humi TaxID=999931 RepID=UPI00370D88B7